MSGFAMIAVFGGAAVGAFFTHDTAPPPEWRLLVVTGFIGGLTTCSTFSLQVVILLGRQAGGWVPGAASLHLTASLVPTATGMLMARCSSGPAGGHA